MFDPFLIEITYKGETRAFDVQLRQTGHHHRFVVLVNDLPFHFETDENGSYRALLPFGADEKQYRRTDAALLEAIARKIEEILE